MLKVALIPIDNRPICYDLVRDILSLDSSIEINLPPLNLLGGLTTSSDIDGLLNYIKNLSDIDYLIVSLDTIAYGGLVNSRRAPEDFETIKKRIEKFKQIASAAAKKILAFSSIMRISNNNINEEEKEYWAQFGKRIFDWSYYLHKSEVLKCANCVYNKVPDEILEDYLATRKRNFEINKIYLDWAREGFFDTLIFSKDDCAEFGLNVKEAREIEQIIKKENIKNVLVKTGADEIPLSLISRAINKDLPVNPIFIEEESKNLISKYEDISIENCVLSQLEIANCKVNRGGLNLIINNFKTEQGDLVLGDIINSTDKKINFEGDFFIADVNNANGADSALIEQLFNQKNDFYGYCGYNTSANTLGCTILTASIKYRAIKNGTYNPEAFKKLQFIRLLDDWSYQAKKRKFVRESAPNFLEALKQKTPDLNKDAKKISAFLNYYPEEINYSLPWDRSFEIRIEIV